jgi:AraC-like DNA-binding protein
VALFLLFCGFSIFFLAVHLQAAFVTAAADVRGRLQILESIVRSRLAAGPPIDRAARLVAARLAATPVRMSDLSVEAGLSERQLHRRCQAAFGYPVSTLARVLRLPRFLALANSPASRDRRAADLVCAAGYTDQAHPRADCRAGRTVGVSPAGSA